MFDGVDEPDRRLKILRAARAEIAQPDAWCPNGYGWPGHYCAIGWIGAFVACQSELMRLTAVLARGLPFWWWFFLGMDRSGFALIATYNDSRRRTQAQMVELFDRAIARLERELAHAA